MKNKEDFLKNLLKKKIFLFFVTGGGTTFLVFLLFIPLFIAVLFCLGLLDGNDSSNSSCVRSQSVGEICNSITIEGQGSMDIDEYVAGVVNGEIGGMVDTSFETYKAGAVAARSYVLANASKDSSGNCVVSNGENFQVYKSNPDENMKKAATDTSGQVMVLDSKVYSTQYDAFCWDKKDSSDYYICQGHGDNLKIPSSWVDSKVAKTYLAAPHTSSHGNGMSQYGAWYLATEKNYDYKSILDYFYGDEGATLATANGVTSNCSSTLTSLSNYNLGHQGLNILNRTLTSSEIANLNSFINNEVDKAGYGTGDGVAAAGQSLVYGLEQMGYYLGYCWGGDRSSVGVGSQWGASSSSCDSDKNTHPYYGMDCSGFVSWAIRNGCSNDFSSATTYDMDYGPHIDVTKAKPGDLMLNLTSHVRLVVKNNGDGTVITAESGGSAGDLNFSVHGNEVGYNYIDMSNFYKKTCKDTNPSTGNKRGSVSSSSSSAISTGDNLQVQINNYISNNAVSGTWSVYIKNLKTKKVVDINASRKMNSASSIKLFVLASAYDKVKNGDILENKIKSDAKLMIEQSSNDNTNNIIKTIGGISVVNKYITKNGYSSTQLNRLFGGNYTNSGIDNYTSARDTGVLLEKIYNSSLISAKYSKTMLSFLKNQNTRSKIPAGVSNGTVANKTGEIPAQGVQNDSAIVYSSGADYIISVMSTTSDSNGAINNIKEISNIVYNYYNK